MSKVFARLYELADNKLETVAHMHARGWGLNGEAWKWRQRLYVWEEELLGECVGQLTSVTLKVECADRWVWTLHVSNCYTFSSANSSLIKVENVRHHHFNKFLWLKAVSLKVSIFAWRLFLNWVPTRDNLVHRRVLLASDQSCVANCGYNEDDDHFF